jgi:hypothetical protein
MLLTASFAAAGAWNASSVAATKCGPDVQAVYTCSNFAVKVVSSNGSTFYKSDGSSISCPDAPLGQIGAECMQLLIPNPCTAQVTCQTTVIQNQTMPTIQVSNSSVGTGTETAPVVVPTVASVNVTGVPAGQKLANQTEVDVAAPEPNNFEFSMSNLALVVLLLGVVAVIVLFTLFKNSIAE